MYENLKQSLLAKDLFYSRLVKHILLMFAIILFSLLLGVFGYRYIVGLTWIDALYNASMILSGMGPVTNLTDNGSKVFASFYALFSAVAFLSGITVVLAPLIHRFLHRLHFEPGREDESAP